MTELGARLQPISAILEKLDVHDHVELVEASQRIEGIRLAAQEDLENRVLELGAHYKCDPEELIMVVAIADAALRVIWKLKAVAEPYHGSGRE